jgi:hypothetical protein
VDYRTRAKRRLDMANLIGDVLYIFVKKLQNINFIEFLSKNYVAVTSVKE